MRMANGGEAAGYWLPSEFLTDDDFLMDKENLGNTHIYQLDFPTDFPFDFQTHSDHLLQKFCAMSTSPRSTPAGLSGAGGPNGAQLPHAGLKSPRYDAVEDLMYLAAGEAPKLRLSRGGCAMNSCPRQRIFPQFHKEAKLPTPSGYTNAPPQFEKAGSRAVRGMGHAAWGPYQNHNHNHGGGGAAARKACAGTGVFLPRRYDTNSFSSCPRSIPAAGCSASPFHGRSSAQLHTEHLVYRFVERLETHEPHPKIGVAFAPEHNSVLARRHALFLLQQKRSFSTGVAEGRDHLRLPQEWSY